MKKFSREEVAQQIRDCGTSLDSAYSESYSYYIHIDEETGDFAPYIRPGVVTFEWPAPYVDDIMDEAQAVHPDDDDARDRYFWDHVFDCEADLNSPFGDVVDGLTDEINRYFSG